MGLVYGLQAYLKWYSLLLQYEPQKSLWLWYAEAEKEDSYVSDSKDASSIIHYRSLLAGPYQN